MMFNGLMHQESAGSEDDGFYEACGVAAAAIVADDLTGVGIGDDFALLGIGAAVAGKFVYDNAESIWDNVKLLTTAGYVYSKTQVESLVNGVNFYEGHRTNRTKSNWNKHTKTRSGKTYGSARNANRGDKNKKYEHPENVNKKQRHHKKKK